MASPQGGEAMPRTSPYDIELSADERAELAHQAPSRAPHTLAPDRRKGKSLVQ
jgi:hypothetical protein